MKYACKCNFKKSDLLKKAYYIIVGDDEKDENLEGAQCTKTIAGVERNIFITYSCDIDNSGNQNILDIFIILNVWQAECETLSIKQDIFADLEKLCPPHCIFTSTSSTFSLKLIGERTKCQDRIAGIHFFW